LFDTLAVGSPPANATERAAPAYRRGLPQDSRSAAVVLLVLDCNIGDEVLEILSAA